MHDNTARRLSRLHVIVYRLTGGVLGRRLVRNDMLLLTTRGRATRKAHTVPLLYLREGDTLVVIASWGGRPRDPDWYRNLVAEPRAIVQVGTRIWAVRARTANTDEREVWWPRIVAAYAGYRRYQSHTNRTIPVVLLEPFPHHRRVRVLRRAFPDGVIPAIAVYEVVGMYFLVDRHDRVALAYRLRMVYVDAEVTVIAPPTP